MAHVTVVDAVELVVLVDEDLGRLEVQLVRVRVNDPLGQPLRVGAQRRRVAVLVREEAENVTFGVAHVEVDLAVFFPRVGDVSDVRVVAVEPLCPLLVPR